MNNQGILRSAAGTPVADGAYALTFALYASASAPTPLWTETVPDVAVQGGLYSTVLGSVTPFPAALFRDHASLWLGVTVGTGAELPRARLLTLAYAFEADHALVATAAETLTCTDCVDEAALSFDLCSATASCAPTLQAGTGLTLDGTTFNVKQATVTDWAKLACYDNATELRAALDAVYAPLAHAHAGTDITGPVAECVEAQNAQALEGNSLAQVEDAVLGAVTAAGYLKNTDKIDQAQLPANGLDEVSNGLLTNQFQDTTAAADTPVPIRDFYPPGVSSTLTFPDVGIAEKLTVSIDLSNSNVSGITVTLTDPGNVQYVLYDRGSTGATLQATYPDPTAPVSGNLATWVGKNPKGTWRLSVVDSHFDNKTWPVEDGLLADWSVTTKTLSAKKVNVNGDLVVSGTLWVEGGFSGAGPSLQVFSTSGSFTAPVDGRYRITTVGGGGGYTASSCSSGCVYGGGGGGGMAIGIVALEAGVQYPVTVGTGGMANCATPTCDQALSGGASSFQGISGGGGGGGWTIHGSGNPSGVGGVGSGGSLNMTGRPGAGSSSSIGESAFASGLDYGTGGGVRYANGKPGIVIIEW